MTAKTSRLLSAAVACFLSLTACASIKSVKEIRGQIAQIFDQLKGHDERITNAEKNIIELTLSDDTLFKTNSAVLSETASVQLKKITKVLDNNPGVYLLIGGHTDNTGSEEHNMKLSKARADAVAEAIRSSGFPADHIMTVGYGESQPIAGNTTEEGRGLNRRVTISIAEKKEDLVAK